MTLSAQNTPETWAVFDALPAIVRQVVAAAPYTYAPEGIRDAYLHGQTLGWSDRQFAKWLVEVVIPGDMRKQAIVPRDFTPPLRP